VACRAGRGRAESRRLLLRPTTSPQDLLGIFSAPPPLALCVDSEGAVRSAHACSCFAARFGRIPCKKSVGAKPSTSISTERTFAYQSNGNTYSEGDRFPHDAPTGKEIRGAINFRRVAGKFFPCPQASFLTWATKCCPQAPPLWANGLRSPDDSRRNTNGAGVPALRPWA